MVFLLNSELLIGATHKAPVASGTVIVDGQIRYITIYDKYPETSDGKRELLFAAFFESDYEGTLAKFPDEMLKKIQEIGYAIHRRPSIYGEWTPDGSGPEIYYFPSYRDTLSDLESFIETLDYRVDGDDRLILFFVGHGSYVHGEYCFRLEDGTYVSASTLCKYLNIIGPGVDFVWFLSCYSSYFAEKYSEDLLAEIKEFIFWGYTGATLISAMEKQLNTFYSYLYNEGVTIVEQLNNYVSRTNRTQYDYWPGYLNISALGPAYDEPAKPPELGYVIAPGYIIYPY